MPHLPQPSCLPRHYGDGQCQVSQASKEQDLLLVAAEVQRMVEVGGFRPISLDEVGKKLSMTSYMLLMQHNVGLMEVLEANPKSVRVTEHEGRPVVSWYGVTWLGPGCPPPQRVPEPGPVAWAAASEPPCQQGGSGNGTLMRGKALENMSQIAGTPELQEALRDIASCLLAAPQYTLLVSELGCKIAPGSRTFLRTSKLRAAQLLQCFSEDFELQGTGPGTAVKFLHETMPHRFRPQPRVRGLNNQRYSRLVKLAADVSEGYGGRNITAPEVLKDPTRYLLVDCRTLAERTASVLPNSVAAVDLTDRDLAGGEIIVAYCAIGCRSAKWCKTVLTSAGGANGGAFTRLRYMVGGVAAWALCGGHFVDPRTGMVTKKVHCWVKEFEGFFPVARSGCEVVATALPPDGHWLEPLPADALQVASGIRFTRLRSLAWEVRLRYWPSVFCIEAQDIISSMRAGDLSSFILVDCRTPEEREVSMIEGEGLLVLTSEEFNARADVILNSHPELTVVTYCTVGGRSGIWSKRFIERFTQEGRWAGRVEDLSRKVLNLLGGIAGWLHSGGKLSSKGVRTTYLHPWCHAFLDLFPLQDLQINFDESMPDPADALCFAACRPSCEEAPDRAVPQKLLQICTTIPREVLGDSLTRAMRSVLSYED